MIVCPGPRNPPGKGSWPLEEIHHIQKVATGRYTVHGCLRRFSEGPPAREESAAGEKFLWILDRGHELRPRS